MEISDDCFLKTQEISRTFASLRQSQRAETVTVNQGFPDVSIFINFYKSYSLLFDKKKGISKTNLIMKIVYVSFQARISRELCIALRAFKSLQTKKLH